MQGRATGGPRTTSRSGALWEQDLALRDAPRLGKADAWGELNHLDEHYLEFSRASDTPRGLALTMGLGLLAVGWFLTTIMLGSWEGVDAWIRIVGYVLWLIVFSHAAFFLRFDLRLPKDRPVRFNRHQGKVYANEYAWNYNPLGRWQGTARVLNWGDVQAEITKQFGASGEVVTQRYSLDLVVCKAEPDTGPFEEAERLRLQQGASTTVQYEEQWELIRRYMAEGPHSLPPQTLRDCNPGFVDCLLFAMPWFAPTEAGRQARARLRGVLGTLMATLMSLAFPLWLLFGLGNYVVMRVAPEATWPLDLDARSRSSG